MKHMKIVMLFIVLLITISTQAQSDRDSLMRVWNDEALADTSRLNAIDQLGFDFIDPAPDSAIHYALMQNKFAEERGLKEYSADALDVLGRAYESKGELSDAFNYFQRSYELYEEVGNRKNSARALYAIGLVKWTAGDYEMAKEYHHRSMAIANEIGDKGRVSSCLNGIAYCFFQQGQFVKAAEYVQQSLKISEELEDDNGIAWGLNAIGVFYSRGGDSEKALEYYKKGLEINERIGDRISIAYSLRNIGNTYFRLGDPEKSLDFYERSLVISEELNDKRSIAMSLSSIGHLLSELDEMDRAMEYYQRSLSLSKEIGNRDMECEDLKDIGWLHMEQGNYVLGIAECQKSYDIALEIGSVVDQLDACKCLYEANKALGEDAKALAFHEKMLVLRDSIDSESIAKTLLQMEFQNSVLQDSIVKAEEARLLEDAHKEEIRKKNQTRNIGIGIGFFILLLAGGLYSRLRYVRKSKIIIEKERDRSDNLLLNILPEEIAQELKEKGKAAARDFDMVSILFTDFKDFTQASAKLSAQELVTEINTCFEAFDGIIGKFGIEKIKTIGDAYMAAGGLPVPTADSIRNTALAALEMQEFIIKRKAKKDTLGQPAFEMRCGIHTGPVVAGIVGVKKFQYDVWGDTVNTASRIESNSKAGKVNISQTTYELLNNDPQFNFESRGKIEVKGKGEIEMWFIS